MSAFAAAETTNQFSLKEIVWHALVEAGVDPRAGDFVDAIFDGTDDEATVLEKVATFRTYDSETFRLEIVAGLVIALRAAAAAHCEALS